jgi:putative protease
MPRTSPEKRPEILAPVGDMDMCLAAVHNGADAIYVGFPGFNARGRAIDHSWDELEAMIAFCHAHEVKVFLALNVLLFEKELRELAELLPRALAAGPDAFIVQDIGVARLLRYLCPEQAIHASTQMTVTNAEAIGLTSDLGMARYVLGREVSIPEMALIRAATDKELEVFVHGALCVSYSGQCLTSESFGGRSANRGQCAQSCRMEYDLLVDGEKRDLGARRYLVSPKDLCGLGEVAALAALGIDSFKIEGRLKTPQYVASTASAYRRAVAAALGEVPPGFPADPADRAAAGLAAAPPGDPSGLQVTYSRGFFSGWLGGVDHQRLVDGRYGAHRGLELGAVLARGPGALRIPDAHPLRPGDGLLFADLTGPGGRTWGGRIFSVTPVRGSGAVDVAFANDFPLGEIPIGSACWLNDSPSLEKALRQSYTDKARWKTVAVGMRAEGRAGEPFTLTVTDPQGRTGTGRSALPLSPARSASASLTRAKAETEAEALAGSGFRLEGFEYALPDGLYLPEKELRKARQSAVAELRARRAAPEARAVRPSGEALAWMDAEALEGARRAPAPADPDRPRLNLLIRETASLEALEGLPIDTVYLDFEHGKDYKPSLARVRSLGYRAGIATTRILKPAEYHNLKVIEALAPDAVLVRNLGALQWLTGKGLSLAGDFSLNAGNSLAASWLLGKGLGTVCPSYDLNQWQLSDLIDALAAADPAAPRRLEITVHQYLPGFHMEHCVFAAFMSAGSSFKDCGKPCERHRVELRDHTGAAHPVKADQECRNTMFNGRPQSAAMLVPGLLAKGVRRFRVEALYEDGAALRAKVEAYASLLGGEAAPAEVFARMGLVEKYGVMEGQWRNAAVYQDRKKAR